MKSVVFTLLPVLVLSGCAYSNIEYGLAGMVGKPVDQAVAKLGQPDAERQVGESRVVEWRHRSYGTSITGYGSKFPGPGSIASMEYAMERPQVFTMMPTVIVGKTPETCKVTMLVDGSNIIRRYDYTGNFEGCYILGQALKDKA